MPFHPGAFSCPDRGDSAATAQQYAALTGTLMYRSNLNSRDKGGAIAGVIAVHAGLLFALLHLSGRIDLADPQSVLRVFDVTEVPPPPPPRPDIPKPAEKAQKPKEREGAASPPNLKSQATPVVAPKRRADLRLPAPLRRPAPGRRRPAALLKKR